MFGYVKIQKSELRVWEYETYKAIYCSLCRELGKTYGFLARLTLSYDFTFLAVLSLSQKAGPNKFSKKRCAFNPLKKCNYCEDGTHDLEFSASAAMVMLYYKLLDNIDDSSGLKRIFYKLLIPFFKLKHKKAKTLYPKINEIVEEYIQKQSKLERNNCTNLDEIAEPTANALGKIFGMSTDTDADKRPLYQLGYSIGKWIYLIDVANDIEKDIKTGSFNPLKSEIPSGENPLQYAKTRLLPILNTCIYNATLSFELIDIKKYKGILENIIYLGLKHTQATVFSKEETKK